MLFWESWFEGCGRAGRRFQRARRRAFLILGPSSALKWARECGWWVVEWWWSGCGWCEDMLALRGTCSGAGLSSGEDWYDGWPSVCLCLTNQINHIKCFIYISTTNQSCLQSTRPHPYSIPYCHPIHRFVLLLHLQCRVHLSLSSVRRT